MSLRDKHFEYVHTPKHGSWLNLRQSTGDADCFHATASYMAPSSLQAEIEGRTASLLPGLLLARIDGKSPVE